MHNMTWRAIRTRQKSRRLAGSCGIMCAHYTGSLRVAHLRDKMRLPEALCGAPRRHGRALRRARAKAESSGMFVGVFFSVH